MEPLPVPEEVRQWLKDQIAIVVRRDRQRKQKARKRAAEKAEKAAKRAKCEETEGGAVGSGTGASGSTSSLMMCLRSSDGTSNAHEVFLMSACSSATSAPIILSPAELPGRGEYL